MNNKEYNELRRSIRKVETMVMDIYDAVVSDKKICPVCKNTVRLFLPFGENQRFNAKCPVCGSLERHRALWLYFDNNIQLFDKKDMKILHFAPEGVFFNRFSIDDNIDYWPVDINPQQGKIRKVVDITNITFADDSMDMIICNHVLEHIPDEKKAISELYRVLNPNGVAVLSVPIRMNRETTLENPEWNTPELRLKYYGQEDHVRIYGRDFADHLRAANFSVEVVDVSKEYSEEEMIRYGLKKGEQIYLCRK